MVMSALALLGLLASLVLVLAAALSGARATAEGIGWYRRLAKPPWAPPGWFFGLVWTVLYILMAVAAWRVWLRGGLVARAEPLILYGIQLGLNVAWPVLFFADRRPGLAIAVLFMLWWAVVATIKGFYPVDPTAARLLMPYLAWVTLAGLLNLSIWWINRPVAGVRE
jgi:translocator protein